MEALLGGLAETLGAYQMVAPKLTWAAAEKT